MKRRGGAFYKLVEVVDRLRGPRGCPWDRQQTHRSLIRFLREESAELAKALRRGVPEEIEDELGDILFHVVLHARIGRESGRFSIDSVARSQSLKLRRRHPHVFGRHQKFKSARDVILHWKELKAVERRARARDLRRKPATVKTPAG